MRKMQGFSMGNSRWQQTRNAATERLAFGEFGYKIP